MSVVSERLEQRQNGLANANRVRYEVAALKERLGGLSNGEGRELVAGLLLDPQPFLESVSVSKLLSWVNGFGPKGVAFTLGACDVSAAARVCGRYGDRRLRGAVPLTVRQQRVLAERLRTS
jgi:hypothetical protein